MRLYDARHRHGDGGPPTMLLNQNETKETLVAAISSKADPHHGRARLTHTLRGLLKIRELNKTRQCG
jgi:ribose transport system permease protein